MKRVKYANYRLSFLFHEDAEIDHAQLEDMAQEAMSEAREHIMMMAGHRCLVEVDFVYAGLKPKAEINEEYVEFLEEGEGDD